MFAGATPRQHTDWMQTVDQTGWPHAMVITELPERAISEAMAVIGALRSAGVRVLAVTQPGSRTIARALGVADAAARIGIRHNAARKYLARIRDKYTAAGHQARTKLELARLAYDEGFLIR
ncbi:hypothetical protein [Microbacterium sp.]|uniref:hypothetical protein n=1 Tax=Microbacterium sp. TaxID=51671 RepID=UPI0025D82394|nr:hypothetical protein [Microbacterium sp.]